MQTAKETKESASSSAAGANLESFRLIDVKAALKLGLSVLVVYTVHYGSVKAYDAFCVPDGIYGYVQGLLTAASPWCRMTLDIMKFTENQYSSGILMGLSHFAMSKLGI